MKNRRTADPLANMSDTELIDAIRRRDVSVTFRLVAFHGSNAGFYERDDYLRAEAKRRNLL